MSQQASDLPRSVQILGRYKTLIGLLAALGLLGGALFAVLNPPQSATQATIVFATPSCPAGAICGGPAFSPGSLGAPVITGVPSGVQIKSVAGNVVSVSATAGTAALAEAAANKACHVYIAYAGSLSYLGQQPSVTFIQPATIATGATSPKQLFSDMLLGAVVGVLAGVIAALAAGQATIDTPTVAQGLRAGETGGRASRYPPTTVPLRQLAADYSQQMAALDDRLGPFEADPP